LGAFCSTILALSKRIGKLVTDSAACCLVFFAFFVLLVVVYISLSTLVRMPMAWHGPSGKGLTVISYLGEQVGGGNWLRVVTAGLGILAALFFLSSARKVSISFWAAIAFTLLLYLCFQANPNVSPIYSRMVSGENAYTPPPEYLTRRGIDVATRWLYRIHYGEIILYGTMLGQDSITSSYSRGIAFGLAAACLFILLRHVSPIMGAFLGPSVVLMLSRLFSRVGDLDVGKTFWVLPTGLVGGLVVVTVFYLADKILGKAGYFRYLSLGAYRGIPVLAVSLLGCSGFLIYQSIASYDLLWLGVGVILAGIAVASVESWRREYGGL